MCRKVPPHLEKENIGEMSENKKWLHRWTHVNYNLDEVKLFEVLFRLEERMLESGDGSNN